MFKNGILPQLTGWMDQANKYAEMMIAIDMLIAEKAKDGSKRSSHNNQS